MNFKKILAAVAATALTVGVMATDNLTDQQKVEYRTWVSCYGYGYGNLCRVLTDKTVALF